MKEAIPEHVKSFVTNEIETISDLDVLFFLYQQTGKQFDEENISTQLFLSKTIVECALARLMQKSLVRKEFEKYSYDEQCELAKNGFLVELFLYYGERQASIIDMIYPDTKKV